MEASSAAGNCTKIWGRCTTGEARNGCAVIRLGEGSQLCKCERRALRIGHQHGASHHGRTDERVADWLKKVRPCQSATHWPLRASRLVVVHTCIGSAGGGQPVLGVLTLRSDFGAMCCRKRPYVPLYIDRCIALTSSRAASSSAWPLFLATAAAVHNATFAPLSCALKSARR